MVKWWSILVFSLTRIYNKPSSRVKNGNLLGDDFWIPEKTRNWIQKIDPLTYDIDMKSNEEFK